MRRREDRTERDVEEKRPNRRAQSHPFKHVQHAQDPPVWEGLR
jgi:hypothetical protein